MNSCGCSINTSNKCQVVTSVGQLFSTNGSTMIMKLMKPNSTTNQTTNHNDVEININLGGPLKTRITKHFVHLINLM
ncbi:hypothetical protein Hanom_Chr05g00455261 [Helianthus anomalus]